MTEFDLSGPDPEAITRHIVETYPGTDVVTIPGGTFFSLDEKHWPNFATLVTTDDFDDGSGANLSRPGVFRLNLGVGRATFDRLIDDAQSPDYAALDRVLPHPVYARQHWLGILNPSAQSWETVVKPLLAEAHARLAEQRARHIGRPR